MKNFGILADRKNKIILKRAAAMTKLLEEDANIKHLAPEYPSLYQHKEGWIIWQNNYGHFVMQKSSPLEQYIVRTIDDLRFILAQAQKRVEISKK